MRRRLIPFACLLVLLLAFAMAAAAAPNPISEDSVGELRRLSTRMSRTSERQRLREGALGFYARAFVADSAVSLALGQRLGVSEAIALVDRLLRDLVDPLSTSPFSAQTVTVAGRVLPTSVAYRGHLLLVLEGRARLGALSPEQSQLTSELERGLAREVLAAPNHLLPSYGRHTYPADNEVLRAALVLASEQFGEETTRSAVLALTHALEQLERLALPASELVPETLRAAEVPRGCALAWTVAIRGLHDPGSARELYARFRPGFAVERGPLLGFREWPQGVARREDADSGPIVMGIGAAATGLGLAAARVAGRADDVARLALVARVAQGMATSLSPGQQVAARSILLWSTTVRAWRGTKGSAHPAHPERREAESKGARVQELSALPRPGEAEGRAFLDSAPLRSE